VLGLASANALECVDHGVRINALITGNVDRPLYRKLSGVGPDEQLPSAPNPTGRTATPDEVASLVAYLFSDEAAFVDDAGLTIDGGFTAS
jgi:NAD(P)-dependent dehydrogenase (short-subunit alcohol dehydrogenase family)